MFSFIRIFVPSETTRMVYRWGSPSRMPLAFQDQGSEFLLVPYYGACVHTPPPPPNQIVMVGMAGKKSIKLNLFDAVWLSGRLKIASVESPYGTVGFQLEGMKVEPYSSK